VGRFLFSQSFVRSDFSARGYLSDSLLILHVARPSLVLLFIFSFLRAPSFLTLVASSWSSFDLVFHPRIFFFDFPEPALVFLPPAFGFSCPPLGRLSRTFFPPVDRFHLFVTFSLIPFPCDRPNARPLFFQAQFPFSLFFAWRRFPSNTFVVFPGPPALSHLTVGTYL